MVTPKAIIFDFFGTLVPNFSLSEHKAVLGKMADMMKAPREAFVQLWFDTVKLRMTGEFTSVHANVEAICTTLSVPFDAESCEQAVQERYTYERVNMVPRATAIATLHAIRERGLKIGLISDCSIELPDLWRETPFAPLFDVTTFSAVAKIKKPDRRIYEMTAEQLGVACADCLFVGDGGSNELRQLYPEQTMLLNDGGHLGYVPLRWFDRLLYEDVTKFSHLEPIVSDWSGDHPKEKMVLSNSTPLKDHAQSRHVKDRLEDFWH